MQIIPSSACLNTSIRTPSLFLSDVCVLSSGQPVGTLVWKSSGLSVVPALLAGPFSQLPWLERLDSWTGASEWISRWLAGVWPTRDGWIPYMKKCLIRHPKANHCIQNVSAGKHSLLCLQVSTWHLPAGPKMCSKFERSTEPPHCPTSWTLGQTRLVIMGSHQWAAVIAC